jgi:uncharacterized membrane protein
MNHHKIPLNPPFSKGEAINSSLCKREAGRDFQNAKVLGIVKSFMKNQSGGQRKTSKSLPSPNQRLF